MKKNVQGKWLKASILPFFVTLISCLGTGKLALGQSGGRIDFRLQIIGAPNYVDGSALIFNDTASNFIDSKDAPKGVAAVSANLGLLRNDTILIVESRRTILNKDTLTLMFWGLSNNTDYYLHMFPQNISEFLTATLVDSFENTSESIDLSQNFTKVFSVTPDPLSGGGGAAVNRFAIHFARIPALPVTFVSIDVNKIAAGIEVNWKVEEERGILRYEIMRSSDGKDFAFVGSVPATGNSSYNWVDRNPINGNSFFRIKAVDADGKVKYTNIAKVFSGNINAGISVYPNPVQGGLVNLQFVNHPKGRYDVQLVNNSGQIVYKGYVEHPGRNSLQFVNLHSGITGGSYRLVVTGGPDKIKTIQNVFIHSIK